jgi:GDP-L-fucose synthase
MKLVSTLSQIVKFNYKFDNSKPSGFPKRIMDISNAKKILGYRPMNSLMDGLRKTWNWYFKNYNENKKRHNYFK